MYDENQPILESKLQEMQEKVAQQMHELELVSWYINVFEDGKDTRELIELYDKLKKEHVVLLLQHEKSQMKLQMNLNRTKKELADAFNQLKRQQEQVIEPLTTLCKAREQEICQLKETNK